MQQEKSDAVETDLPTLQSVSVPHLMRQTSAGAVLLMLITNQPTITLQSSIARQILKQNL
jgi:hypothetical protein